MSNQDTFYRLREIALAAASASTRQIAFTSSTPDGVQNAAVLAINDKVVALQALPPGSPTEASFSGLAAGRNPGDVLSVNATVTGAEFLPRYLPSVAALKALDYTKLTDGYEVQLMGYYSAGDGGGGVVRWNPTSSAAADDGIAIKPTGLVGNGLWIRVVENESIDVRCYGAVPNNKAVDNTPFFSAFFQSAYVNQYARPALYIPPNVGPFWIRDTIEVQAVVGNQNPTRIVGTPNTVGNGSTICCDEDYDWSYKPAIRFGYASRDLQVYGITLTGPCTAGRGGFSTWHSSPGGLTPTQQKQYFWHRGSCGIEMTDSSSSLVLSQCGVSGFEANLCIGSQSHRVDGAAALAAFVAWGGRPNIDGFTVYLTYLNTSGDGLGGVFNFSKTSTATPDGVDIIDAAASMKSSGQGRWLRSVSPYWNPGATGNQGDNIAIDKCTFSRCLYGIRCFSSNTIISYVKDCTFNCVNSIWVQGGATIRSIAGGWVNASGPDYGNAYTGTDFPASRMFQSSISACTSSTVTISDATYAEVGMVAMFSVSNNAANLHSPCLNVCRRITAIDAGGVLTLSGTIWNSAGKVGGTLTFGFVASGFVEFISGTVGKVDGVRFESHEIYNWKAIYVEGSGDVINSSFTSSGTQLATTPSPWPPHNTYVHDIAMRGGGVLTCFSTLFRPKALVTTGTGYVHQRGCEYYSPFLFVGASTGTRTSWVNESNDYTARWGVGSVGGTNSSLTTPISDFMRWSVGVAYTNHYEVNGDALSNVASTSTINGRFWVPGSFVRYGFTYAYTARQGFPHGGWVVPNDYSDRFSVYGTTDPSNATITGCRTTSGSARVLVPIASIGNLHSGLVIQAVPSAGNVFSNAGIGNVAVVEVLDWADQETIGSTTYVTAWMNSAAIATDTNCGIFGIMPTLKPVGTSTYFGSKAPDGSFNWPTAPSGVPLYTNLSVLQWKIGDVIWNGAPTSGAPSGWVCTTGGLEGSGAAFASFGVTGDTQSVQNASPLNGDNVAALTTTETLYLTPAGTIAGATITFPTGAYVGRQFVVVTTQEITTPTWTAAGHTVTNAPATLAANAYVTFRKVAATAWMRVA